MSKRKTLLMAVLSAVFLLSCILFAACASATTYAITWAVDEHAAVTVVGEGSLPEEWEADTELVFTVSCDDGYEVSSVKAGTTTVKADDSGQYSVTVTKDVTITVTASIQISSVEVTSLPDTLTYYAGESLDTTGMVVTVTYATGESEAVTGYVVSPSTFHLGDVSFTVTYKGYTTEEIPLESAVEAKITIDPAGGTIDEDVLAEYESRTDLNNYAVDDDGVITFTYLSLDEDLVLPTSDQVSKGENEGDFNFVGWYAYADEDDDGTEIEALTSENEDSLTIELQWDARLVTLNSIELATENDAGETGAYLVMNITFEAAESVYIYLYEGNDDVELIGTEYTGSSGETMDIYFDLSILGNYNDGEYSGKWMDLCFNAEIEGRTYTQSFVLDHDDPIAEMGGAVQDSNYSYTLLTYRSGSYDYIKVAFTDYYTTYSFSVSGSTLTISGVVNLNKIDGGADALDGASVSLTMGSISGTGSIDTAGAWSIEYDLTLFDVTSQNSFGNLTVIASDGATVLLESDLRYTQATDYFEYSGNTFSNPSYYSNSYSFGDGLKLYVGYMGSDWTTAFYSIQQDISYDSITLTSDDDGVYIVISGTYGSSMTAEDVKTSIEESFYLDLQSYSNSWSYRLYSTESGFTVTVNDDGTFTVTIGLSSSSAIAGDVLYGHFGDSSSNMALDYVEASVTYDGITYTIGAANDSCDLSWMSDLTIIYVTVSEEYDIDYTYTAASLSADDDGVYLIISGTYDTSNDADAVQTAIGLSFYLELQNYGSNDQWAYHLYTSETGFTVTVNDDGTFTVSVELTSSAASIVAGDILYAHLEGDDMALDYTEASYTYGGLTYTMGAADSSWDSWLADLVIIYVTVSEEYDIDYTYTAASLSADDDGVYLVISGTYDTSYDADAVQTAIGLSFYLELQNYGSVDQWAYHLYTSETGFTVTVNDDGTFTVSVELTSSAASIVAGDILYAHLEGDDMALDYTEASYTYGGLTYTMGAADSSWDSWLADLVIIYVTSAD